MRGRLVALKITPNFHRGKLLWHAHVPCYRLSEQLKARTHSTIRGVELHAWHSDEHHCTSTG